MFWLPYRHSENIYLKIHQRHSGEIPETSKELITLEFFTLKFFELGWGDNVIIRVREGKKNHCFIFMIKLVSQLASRELFFSFHALFCFVDMHLFIFMLYNCDRYVSWTINCLIVDLLNYIKSRLGTLEPWSLGVLESWSLGALEPWSLYRIFLHWMILYCKRIPTPRYFESWIVYYTYSMEQSPSWEAVWFVASQEIPRILLNPKVHYRIRNCPPPVSILSQPNPVHTSHITLPEDPS
jgi:hypothetical protein